MQDVIQNTLVYEQRNFSDQCLLNEKCVGGLGQREILRFSTEIRNIGTTDYFIGRTPIDPLAASSQFIWDECHRHWHFRAYAKYGLYDATGKELPTSFKNGFCVEDLGRFVPNGVPKYTCDNQGISVGCYDKYDLNLPCQWIDITGLASGIYKLVVDVNWLKQKDNNGRDELNYNNNTATVCFQVTRNGASATVTKLNCDTNIGGGIIPPSTTGVVTVYESKEYAGRVLSLNQGTYSAANLGALNLNISALTVMNGYQVRACRADGYCRTFTANTPFVGSDMDNQIVSLEVSTKSTISPTCNVAFTTSTVAASCASNDGQVTLSINGGTPPYQAALDGSTTFSSTFTFGGVASGGHTATVRDNAGCIVTQSFVIAKNCTVINCNNVIVSLTPTAATCAGNDGILDKLVLGGTPPYLFSIDGKTPQADPSFSGLSVGAHYVIVKDNVGCNVRKDFTVTQDCIPVCAVTATAQPINVTCAGNDGKVTITAGNGTAPYSYAIDGKTAQTSNTFSLLAEGNHNVVVIDAKNCTKSVTFTIGKTCIAPICAVTATVQSTTVTCSGNDGKATVLAGGGTAPYTYAIDGKAAQTTASFAALAEGNHSVIITDATSCKQTITFVIGKSTLNGTAKITESTCVDNNGRITVTATGGTSSYRYSITGNTWQTSNIFTGLAAKTYNVQIRDSAVCIKSLSIVVTKRCSTTIAPTCTLSATTQVTESTCTNNDGKITITASGGILPYRYAVAGLPWQTSNVFAGLAANTYSIQVRDTTGCIRLLITTVTQRCTTTVTPTCAVTATAQTTNVTCAGNDGKVTVTAGNGTAPYTYALDGKLPQSDPIFYTLAEGTHSVVVTDAKACAKSVTFTIGKTCTPCAVTATAQVIPVTCAGNDGKVTLTASGGTAPYQYAIAGITWQTSNIFTGLTNKSYDFWINDSKGCNILVTASITKNCVPCAITLSSQVTAATCAGNDGKITVTAAGGTAPYTYTLTGGTAQTTNIFSGLTEKTYQILVSDSKGCNAVATATISKTCAGFDPNKCYRFVFTHSGQVLDVRNSSTANGAIIQQYVWHGGKNQIWKIQSIGNGYYKIVSTNTSKVLDVPNSTSSSAVIRQWDYVGGSNQQWQIIATGTNVYKLVNKYSGKVTDIPGTNVTTNGVALQQNTDSNQADQRFRIEAVTCPVVREDADEITQVTIFPNPSKKEVNIRMNEAFAERLTDIKVYDVIGNIVMQTDTRSQEISFEILKDGFYIIAIASKDGSVLTKKLIIRNKEE